MSKEVLEQLEVEKLDDLQCIRGKIKTLREEERGVLADLRAVSMLLGTAPMVIDVNSLTFRDAIRAILADHPGGLTPAKVCSILIDLGLSYNLATPLNVRVCNEMRRMTDVRQEGKNWILS